ncbi:hypothetical protein [Comamonas sp. JC664]|uniref:hypothetical protein n=1 Tax=Comamonas sp. JC664 TaxID=2801917 RepID=UPI003605CD75
MLVGLGFKPLYAAACADRQYRTGGVWCDGHSDIVAARSQASMPLRLARWPVASCLS